MGQPAPPYHGCLSLPLSSNFWMVPIAMEPCGRVIIEKGGGYMLRKIWVFKLELPVGCN